MSWCYGFRRSPSRHVSAFSRLGFLTLFSNEAKIMKFSAVFTRLKGMPSVALLAMACSAFGGFASSAPFTWNGSGSNSLWGTGSNWVGGVAASGTNPLIFGGQLRTTSTNNLTLTTGSIGFSNTNPAWSGFILTGSSLATTSGAKITTAQLSGTGTVLETIANDLKMGGAMTLTASGSAGSFHNLLISGNLSNGTSAVNNNVTIANGNGAQVFLSGNNVNVGFYTVNAGGILTTLGTSALNSQTVAVNGTINVNGGELKVGPLSGTGLITTSTTGLQDVIVNNANSSTFAGSIQNGSGTLALVKSGTGSMTLSGSNTYTGATTVNAGALTIGSAGSISSSSVVQINGGALNYAKTGDTTFANVLNGTGTTGAFNLTSDGTVLVSSTGNFGGTINTGSSTATFTGNLAGAAVNVGPGGFIYGTGTLGNVTVADSSTVSAGLAGGIGKLSVGSYTVIDSTDTTKFDIVGSGTSAPLVAVAPPAAPPVPPLPPAPAAPPSPPALPSWPGVPGVVPSSPV
jgi:autotransporter-associated beta strand protein